VGELGLLRSALTRLGEQTKADHGFVGYSMELHKINKLLERKLAELQESVMDVRMVPLRHVFDKLSRVVRKLSRETGKRVKLEVEGADTELDKLIIEELVDPLMHIVRNAMDHGIEPRADRLAMGKPEEGVIRIKAAQRGNHVVIEVCDDGRGMDTAVLRETAIEKGLISSTEQLSNREIFDLILLPGFSTKKVVTEVSGRGVGMDVVKENISRLSGIVDIDSEPGKGARFSIVLPITLAIIQALIVEAGDKPYAVPLNSVLECITIHRDDIQKIEQHEVLQLRDEILSLARLDRIFHPDRGGEPPEKGFVVVVGLAEHRLGLVVDRLCGRQDIVIKSIGKSLQNIRGIAGATELGDQRTILVVDIGALIEDSVRRHD
jgi:two-component system chemotaxis sensor kinase CheA